MSSHAKKQTAQAQPPEMPPVEEQREHIHEILTKTADVMLLTFEATGATPRLSGRPLHVTALDEDDTMWFMVGLDSKKVQQIRKHDRVVITAQSGARWIQIDARAHIVTDRAKVRALFGKMHEVWFPGGVEDPNVGLLRVQPEHAEYWDTSGLDGVRYLYAVAKALLTGTAAEPIEGTHGKVSS